MILNKYSIKIPDLVSIFYFKNINTIVLKSKNIIRFLNVDSNLRILIYKNKIFVVNNFLLKSSSNFKKKLSFLKTELLDLFRHFLIEIQVKIYSKLKCVGIGFKFFQTNYPKILLLKLGYSHPIYLKLNLNFLNLKSVKLFIFSKSYKNLIKTSALIRSFKYPDPYKGKGLVYMNENLKLRVNSKKN